MAKIEYPKMIYLNGDRDNHIIVQNIEEHDKKKAEGYCGLGETTTAQTMPDPDPDADEDTVADPVPFACSKCEFIGKSTQSLRMHTFKKHGG